MQEFLAKVAAESNAKPIVLIGQEIDNINCDNKSA
tara:strand:+ start:231 stop:335 length:105 start_codon:yes stop_codon:yes gene_type:complete